MSCKYLKGLTNVDNIRRRLFFKQKGNWGKKTSKESSNRNKKYIVKRRIFLFFLKKKKQKRMICYALSAVLMKLYCRMTMNYRWIISFLLKRDEYKVDGENGTLRRNGTHQSTSSIPPGTKEKGKGRGGGGPWLLTGGWPKLNEKVGTAGAGDEFEEDAFGLAVLAGDEVAGDLFAEDLLAPFFASWERARLIFLRWVLENEFRAVNASATWALFGRSRILWNKEGESQSYKGRTKWKYLLIISVTASKPQSHGIKSMPLR
jgi:hypothetical protein